MPTYRARIRDGTNSWRGRLGLKLGMRPSGRIDSIPMRTGALEISCKVVLGRVLTSWLGPPNKGAATKWAYCATTRGSLVFAFACVNCGD